MPLFLTRVRARFSLSRLLAAVAGAVAVSLGIVLMLTGTAQADNEPWYVQPAPGSEQLTAYSGNDQGQTASPASYATALCVGSTLRVSLHLISTNEPRTAFQVYYNLDFAAWVLSDTFTTGWNGTGGGTFTVDDVSAGAHQVALDINPAAGGGTYYLDLSREAGGGVGIYFSCVPKP
jgi:hypothetical protein